MADFWQNHKLNLSTCFWLFFEIKDIDDLKSVDFRVSICFLLRFETLLTGFPLSPNPIPISGVVGFVVSAQCFLLLWLQKVVHFTLPFDHVSVALVVGFLIPDSGFAVLAVVFLLFCVGHGAN